ncbi:MAG TPA: hypothetical protein DER64_13580 [Planctomycetaceae bacterium]|nr:hypothetical protein [Planctomycetaceae bacterium]
MSRPLSDWDRWVGLRAQPEILELLENSSDRELGLQDRLRKRFEVDLVRTAFQLRDARSRATSRFGQSVDLWFDRVGLEQATGEAVACHKAQRFHEFTWDLCCGVGGDAMSLGRVAHVVGVDRDPAKVLCCRWNAEAVGVGDRVAVVAADIRRLGRLRGLVHIDPDQRPGGAKRSHRIEDSEPGREYLEDLIASSEGGAIKLSPAANFLGKFPGCEIELVSVGRECKQAIVWFGGLAGAPPLGQVNLFRATSLPSGETLEGHPLASPFRMEMPGEYLFDPDPAVVRAGLVDRLAEQCGAWRLDDREEYLSGDGLPETTLAQAFRVMEVTANKPRPIREAARSLGFGPVEIKCRHVPVDADMMRRKLKLDGDRPGVVIVAKINGRTRAVLACRVAARPPTGPPNA